MRFRPGIVLHSRYGILIALLLLFLAAGIPFYIALWWTQYGPTRSQLVEYLSYHSPSSPLSSVPAPPLVPSLLLGTSPSLIPSPVLLHPSCPLNSTAPLLLALHIFSNARFNFSSARLRRNIIRRTIYMGVPHKYRYLVDVKFIMGRSWDPAIETLHDREENRWGDMIRLGIPDGDGERGKAGEWLSVIGRGREAQWVMKCEDDALPILPNLIPFLLSLNPSQPIILGSSFKSDHTKPPSFSKEMYGFSWPVVRSIADAKLGEEEKNRDVSEEEFIAGLMYSLPSLPGKPQPLIGSTISPYPTSSDKRTGLTWADVGRRIGQWGKYWTSPGRSALAWHGLEDDRAYEELALGEIIKDIHAAGRRYVWDVPDEMKYLASDCSK